MTIKEFEIQLALGTLTYNMKIDLACNPNTPEKVLTILSTDKYWCVRYDIAENPNTPKRILTKLLADEDWAVRKIAIHQSQRGVDSVERLNAKDNFKLTPP